MYLLPLYGAHPVERLGMLLLDTRARLIREQILSVGGLDYSGAHPRDVLRPAIAAGALLVALYTISEFGAVAMLRYDTLTPLVYIQYTTSFDRASAAVLGLPPKAFEKRHGLGKFWQKLAQAPDFYFSLPLMDDAMELFDAVRHLDPVILTGLPRGNWAADQKVRWAAKHFPGTRIITTMARDKRDHARQSKH